LLYNTNSRVVGGVEDFEKQLKNSSSGEMISSLMALKSNLLQYKLSEYL